MEFEDKCPTCGRRIADLSALERRIALIEDKLARRGRSITFLDLSARARHILEDMGVRTIQELADCSSRQLLRQNNCGQTTIDTIRSALRAHGADLFDCS